jgi:hypothetical protein
VKNKASKRFGTKIRPPWTSLTFLFVGGYMLFLQVPYATPPFETLTPVTCGIPQALKSI